MSVITENARIQEEPAAPSGRPGDTLADLPADVLQSDSIDPAGVCPPTDPAESAQNLLQHSHYGAIRRVQCSADDGVLTLSGLVPTFHYKQLAQTAVADIAGVRQVINLIEVG